eukprot:7331722-Prymnesium_polylepis.1
MAQGWALPAACAVSVAAVQRGGAPRSLHGSKCVGEGGAERDEGDGGDGGLDVHLAAHLRGEV